MAFTDHNSRAIIMRSLTEALEIALHREMTHEEALSYTSKLTIEQKTMYLDKVVEDVVYYNYIAYILSTCGTKDQLRKTVKYVIGVPE
jgi:hypothetical protein